MAQSTTSGSVASVYSDRIGVDTNENEVTGYWVFLIGLGIGVLGLILYFATDAATMGRGLGYAMAALAPAFIMAGAVLQFPLRKMATYLTGMGLLVTFAAVAWFLFIFPSGWSTTTGNAGVITVYIAGLAIIGIAGVIVPQETPERMADIEPSVVEPNNSALQAEEELEESEINALQTEAGQAKVELDDLKEDLDDTQADEADLGAQLRAVRSSQAQFELYEDRGASWRWRLRHLDGGVLAASNEGYPASVDAQNGLERVRRNALGAPLLLIENEEELPDEGSTDGFVLPADSESQANFELYEDTAGAFRWRLRHENGSILAGCGQGYASRSGAEHSIDRFRVYVGPADYLRPDPTAIEVYRDNAAEWRWRLVHRNGNIIAGSGEGYANRNGARRAIDRLREGIGDMDIEVYEDETGGFRWRLAGGDDLIKADSGRYESRQGAENAVERVREFMPEADIIDIEQAAFEVYEDEAGENRWRLRHRNGNILADGREGYSDRSGALRGIESVKRNALNAGLEA